MTMSKADETIKGFQDKVDANRKAHPRMNSLAFTVDEMHTALDLIADLKESTCNYMVHCAMRGEGARRFSVHSTPFRPNRDLLEDLGIQVIDDPRPQATIPDTCGECRFHYHGDKMALKDDVSDSVCGIDSVAVGRSSILPACPRGVKK